MWWEVGAPPPHSGPLHRQGLGALEGGLGRVPTPWPSQKISCTPATHSKRAR